MAAGALIGRNHEGGGQGQSKGRGVEQVPRLPGGDSLPTRPRVPNRAAATQRPTLRAAERFLFSPELAEWDIWRRTTSPRRRRG